MIRRGQVDEKGFLIENKINGRFQRDHDLFFTDGRHNIDQLMVEVRELNLLSFLATYAGENPD